MAEVKGGRNWSKVNQKFRNRIVDCGIWEEIKTPGMDKSWKDLLRELLGSNVRAPVRTGLYARGDGWLRCLGRLWGWFMMSGCDTGTRVSST